MRYKVREMRYIKHRSNESNLAVVVIFGATIAAIILCIVLLFTGRTEKVYFTGGSNTFMIEEDTYQLSAEPLLCDNVVYVPAADVLAPFGYTISWDSGRNALELVNEDGSSFIFLDSYTASYTGNTVDYPNITFARRGIMYIPVDMMRQFANVELVFEGEYRVFEIPWRDTMADTAINDDYRLTETPTKYNNVYVMQSGIAMEPIAYPRDNCLAYAGVVNNIAAALPNVKVYDEVVPSMAEFYGPAPVYNDQLSGMKLIYENLNTEIMTVNAVKEMWAHAGEKLYFNTDHHWTQRGAYYAYKALMWTKGEEVLPLESFTTQNFDNFVGSWPSFVKGTPGESVLRNHPETLERFMPVTQCTGEVYSDMEMNNRLYPAQVINLNENSYSTFIMGDQPITKFVTGAGTGEKAVLLKESYGDAFATWLINNYDELYVIDPRYWNGFGGHNNPMKLPALYENIGGFNDLIILSSPGSASIDFRNALAALIS